jgi:hypothetical protein
MREFDDEVAETYRDASLIVLAIFVLLTVSGVVVQTQHSRRRSRTTATNTQRDSVRA